MPAARTPRWRCLCVALCVALLQHAAAELASGQFIAIADDQAFEDWVMSTPQCWAVLFTNELRQAELLEIEQSVMHASSEFGKGSGYEFPEVTFGLADVDDVPHIAGEFDVRLMELPQLLVFRKKGRVAEVVPLDPQMATSDFIEGLHDLFVKNWRSEPGGVCQKMEIEINDYPTYIPRDRSMPGPGLEIAQVGRTHFAHGGEL